MIDAARKAMLRAIEMSREDFDAHVEFTGAFGGSSWEYEFKSIVEDAARRGARYVYTALKREMMGPEEKR